MFEFLNVFTPYAQQEKPEKRVAIEERAGTLAAWVVENRKKLY